ncbi:hypothetical protein BTVI_07244 [Pitangus sulphuratus]|nr:hypothetical protein BTVI_07244 [Pitangus sulphuratus]
MMVFERSWPSGEVPEEGKTGTINLFFKKGMKEYPGNYQPVDLTSILGKVMEYLILQVMSIHVDDKKVIRSNQHGFSKGDKESALWALAAYQG